MKNRFKLGDIIIYEFFPDNEMLVLSIDDNTYKVVFITGELDTQKWKIFEQNCLKKISNIFEDKRYEKKKSNSN